MIIFVSVAVMEGVDSSLMSKVIPPVLSRGTFNSGLLAMQVGGADASSPWPACCFRGRVCHL